MGDELRVLASCLPSVAARSEARAGVVLMQARVHLGEPGWRQWVEKDVRIPLERAREWIDAAERAGASVDTLRPAELQA